MLDLNTYFWQRGTVILATLWFLLWRWQVAHAGWMPATLITGLELRTQEVDPTQWRVIEQPGTCALHWKVSLMNDHWELTPLCQTRQHVTFQVTDRLETSLLALSSSEVLSHQAVVFGSGWVSLLVGPGQAIRVHTEGAPFSPSQISQILVQEPGEGVNFNPELFSTTLGSWELYPVFSDGELPTENCHSFSALFQPKREKACQFGSSDGLARPKSP